MPSISGLAKGIDTIAHEWSLRVGLPTISILGTGILVPYPARNTGLAEIIISEGGLIISEYLPYQGPTAENFVWRNRLQACLSECVIATEWKATSGTAHTVRFANELGRKSISLELNGAKHDANLGRAMHHFSLPAEHSDLIHIITHKENNIETEKNSTLTPSETTIEINPSENSIENNLSKQGSLF